MTAVTMSRNRSRSGRRALLDAALAEWTKLWTVRSTSACLATAAALVVLFTVVTGLAGRDQHAHHVTHAMSMSVTDTTALGVGMLGQLAIITLATLVIASEYATTSIRTTLQCVPIRTRMVAAKTVVLAPVCTVVGTLVAGLGALTAWAAMGPYVDPVHASAVAELLIRTGLYLGLTAILVVGIGAVVRSVAGTLIASVVLIVMLPMMLGSVGVHTLSAVAPYLPGGAGQALLGTADSGSYGAGWGAAILGGWAIAANFAGALALRVRDA